MINRLRHWNLIGKYRSKWYREWLYIKDRWSNYLKGRERRKAIKIAIARHKTDGKTYYVLPDGDGILRAFNSKEINALKKMKLMNKRVSIIDLLKESVFVANSRTVNRFSSTK